MSVFEKVSTNCGRSTVLWWKMKCERWKYCELGYRIIKFRELHILNWYSHICTHILQKWQTISFVISLVLFLKVKKITHIAISLYVNPIFHWKLKLQKCNICLYDRAQSDRADWGFYHTTQMQYWCWSQYCISRDLMNTNGHDINA